MKLPAPLVSTDWLSDALDNPSLRIFDTTIVLRHKQDGFGYVPESGADEWRKAHIPGAGFLDVIEALSDRNSALPFMMPPAAEFAATMGAAGVGDDSAVVLYNQGYPMWSTRVWWMLRSIGFDNVAVLDGGWEKWQREGRPTSDTPPQWPPARLSCQPRPQMWVDKDTMLQLGEQAGDTVTLNALSPAVYTGETNQYGRPGHLPGTHNVFYGSLLDADTGEFLPVPALRKLFADSGALAAGRVVTYCGGGISATMDCLALSLCGQDNVAVYDGSMSEWVRDESLPLALGEDP